MPVHQLDFFDTLAGSTLARPWLAGQCPRCGLICMTISPNFEPAGIELFKKQVAERGFVLLEVGDKVAVRDCTCLPKFRHESRTSRIAAQAVDLAKAKADRLRVLEYLQSCGANGATDEEMQIALDMNANTQRPRRVSLVESRWVVKHPQDLQRKTASGRLATVWVANKKIV